MLRALFVLSLPILFSTCDTPSGPRVRPGALAVYPQLPSYARMDISGLTIDQVRITIIRPPSTVVKTVTAPFSPDASEVQVSIDVDVVGSEETLLAQIELMSGTTVVFTGTQDVTVTAGQTTTQPEPVPVNFVGPGSQVAAIAVLPRDTSVTLGQSGQFRTTAMDSSQQPVSQFYVTWSTSGTGSAVSAAGLFTAAAARGATWVKAITPTGIADSARVWLMPAPTAVTLVSGDGQSGGVGQALAAPLKVRVTAADAGPVSGVVVRFAGPTGAVLDSTNIVTDSNGFATTTGHLGSVAGGQTFTATVTGLPVVNFGMTASPGSASVLAFLTQPASTAAGVAIAPPITVAARDAFGNPIGAFNGTVNIALGANPGGAVLGGSLSADATAGVATFSDLSLTRAAAGYTLVASSSGLTSASSSAFTITAGAAATLALVSGGGQNATPGSQLPQPVVVSVTDAYGNGVSGQAVVFAVATGGGSVGTANATTGASGQASTTWTLGSGVGPQTITATAGTLAGSPLTVAANTSGAVSTTVTPNPVTLTALTQTVALSAQAKDAQGANVTGTFTWVSRAPGVATVGPTGVVTAVANGTTYVVASEAAGSKDSAAVTVQQLLATINVTPASRSIYLTRSFTFTAAAVDGLGNPMGGTPTFTWTSTAPAVASVDAAGLVTGVGLGGAQIRATSGAVTGVANVSVLTPITRIAVVVDTVGAATTDTFTMTSLGLTRRYRAIAHDTLDAVMSGITFNWVSTNGSVAVMNTTSGYDTASVTSAANGVTQVRATAQGFASNPGAALTVAQVLASIELAPPASNPTATIGVGGSITLVARGKDANNRYIAGGSFTFTSGTPACATVGATTGLVTGVANCPTDITATSGAITSNPLTVTVGGQVPAVISFGRDTVSVGRGSSTSIPILLSTPVPVGGSSMTVNLTSSDTMAYWNPTSVTIPQGGTSVNATLYGRNAGTVTVTATEGSGFGYAASSAVAKVTANMRLTSGSYAINATDIASTQVLLSDPSPAGGTFVTFSYGTPGIAAISPDPAFIPAGQLAADIQIRGLAGGSTTITPVATGVNGTASSFTAHAPILRPSASFLRLGQGQYEPNVYVYVQTNTNVAIPVSMTSSDSTIVSVPATVTIPGGTYYAYFAITAKGLGQATISLSSPGWTASSDITVVSTTPKVDVCCAATLNTTSPQRNVTVYAEDSLSTTHYRTNSLVVRLASSDSTVLRLLDSVVTIAPGAYYNSSARVIPGGLGGTAWLFATASGHQPDSVQFTVVGPKLQLSWTSARLGVGQYDQSVYAYTPDNVTAPLTVNLSSSDPSSVSVPASVTIPTGTYYAYFNATGVAPGAAQVFATATGYQPDTASYTVTTPTLVTSGSQTINNFGPPRAIAVYSADSTRTTHYRTTPLTVAVASTDPSVVTVDSTTVTIGAGTYYNNLAHITPVGVGTARIVFTAAGHVTLDTITVTVVTPKIQLSIGTSRLGRRQHFDPNGNGFYIYTPDSRTSDLAATITQTNAAADSLTATSLTVPSGTYYRYLDAYGLATGRDTLVVSAPGYLPDTAVIIVTTPHLAASNLPGSTTTTNPPLNLTAYAEDSLGTVHYASDTLVVHATSSDSNVLRPAQPYFRILKNTYYTTTQFNVMGPGTASITFTDSAGTGYQPATTNTVTVTGPSLAISNPTTVLGMRQTGGTNSAYVYAPNNVAADLVVNLVSTDPRVVTVPATVTIPAGTYYAYFPITALDTVGTIQVQATAVGYSAASTNVQVTQPRFLISASQQAYTTSAPRTLTIYAADANGTTHYATEDVFVTLLTSAPAVAVIDSSIITIRAGQYYSQAARWSPPATPTVGTAQLSAQDVRAAYYKYNDGTLSVSVIDPSLTLSWGTKALGVGQYDDNQYVYTPENTVTAIPVTFTHVGTARISTLVGGLPVTGVTIPVGTYYTNFRVVGTSVGTDSLVVSATSPLHNPDTARTLVGLGRVDPLGGWPANLSLSGTDSVLVTIYARDSTQATHYVVAATTFDLAASGSIQFVSGGASSVPITQVTLPADAYYVQVWLKGVSAGTGSATISQANYTTYTTPTVTVSP